MATTKTSNPLYRTGQALERRAAVLVALSKFRHDDPVTYAEIRDAVRRHAGLSLAAETVGSYARKLEAEGLVRIGEGMEARTKYVSLTVAGRTAATTETKPPAEVVDLTLRNETGPCVACGRTCTTQLRRVLLCVVCRSAGLRTVDDVADAREEIAARMERRARTTLLGAPTAESFDDEARRIRKGVSS